MCVCFECGEMWFESIYIYIHHPPLKYARQNILEKIVNTSFIEFIPQIIFFIGCASVSFNTASFLKFMGCELNQRSLWCLNLSGRATASNRTAPLESTGWIFHWLICVITMIWLAHIRLYQPKLLFEQCVSQSKLPTEKSYKSQNIL